MKVSTFSGKTTPIDADKWPIVDTAAGNASKTVTGTNKKAWLKTYFDTLYQAIHADLTALVAAWTPASASGPASLAFAEDTDNGANTVTLIAPASVTADRTITMPNNTGTMALTSDITGGIGGSTGATDNRALRSDGTGGATLQNSLVVLDDSGSALLPTDQSIYIAAGKALSHNSGSGFIAINEGAVGSQTRVYGGIVFLGSSLATYIGTGGVITMTETTEPAAPGANEGVLFLVDNGSGKSVLKIRFATGASQQIAIQP